MSSNPLRALSEQDRGDLADYLWAVPDEKELADLAGYLFKMMGISEQQAEDIMGHELGACSYVDATAKELLARVVYRITANTATINTDRLVYVLGIPVGRTICLKKLDEFRLLDAIQLVDMYVTDNLPSQISEHYRSYAEGSNLDLFATKTVLLSNDKKLILDDRTQQWLPPSRLQGGGLRALRALNKLYSTFLLNNRALRNESAEDASFYTMGNCS